MSRRLSFVFILCAFAIPLIYNNCSNNSGVNFLQEGGVISGNPLTRNALALLDAVCTELTQCNPSITMNACQAGVLADPLNAQFGAPTSYPTFGAVSQAEQSGALTGNQTATDTCITAITSLSCSSSSVQGAYDPALSNAFAGVANMIPAQACAAVYSTPSTLNTSTLNTSSHEYIYFGDQNNANLPGYAINKSTGVLTQIPNTPAMYGNYSLSTAKTSSGAQLLEAAGWGSGGAYLISPTTGVLNPVAGSGFLKDGGTYSPNGLYFYSVAALGSNGWIAQVDPTTGEFTNSVETTTFANPVTHAEFARTSTDGKFVYFIDPINGGVVGYDTAGGTLTAISGTSSGTGTNAGDKTYGVTLLAQPNAGSYFSATSKPYINVAANVLYLIFAGTAGTDNSWIMTYNINRDGSLTTGTPLNIGATPGDKTPPVGDSSGKYLFVAMASGGINTYSIGATSGGLTYVSGPVNSGQYYESLIINSENSLLYAAGNYLSTVSINMTTGALKSISTVLSPCQNGPAALDSSESFIYLASPTTVCGYTVSPTGVVGNITGQTYPMPVAGSGSITSAVTVLTTQ